MTSSSIQLLIYATWLVELARRVRYWKYTVIKRATHLLTHFARTAKVSVFAMMPCNAALSLSHQTKCQTPTAPYPCRSHTPFRAKVGMDATQYIVTCQCFLKTYWRASNQHRSIKARHQLLQVFSCISSCKYSLGGGSNPSISAKKLLRPYTSKAIGALRRIHCSPLPSGFTSSRPI